MTWCQQAAAGSHLSATARHPRGVGAVLQPQFGGTPIGCTSSTNFAAESIKGSENLGPTICRPTGSFAEVRPAGTLAAGSAASDTRKVGPIQSMYILIFLPSTTSG